MLILIRCLFHPHVTAVVRKDTGNSYKSAGVRLHLNTHTPLTQRSRSRLTTPLFRHSVGSYPETSSHATCCLLSDSHRGLTFTWWGCCGLYSPFNCISFNKFSRQLSAFSLCSSGLISALSVLSTIHLFMKVSFSPDSPGAILCG